MKTGLLCAVGGLVLVVSSGCGPSWTVIKESNPNPYLGNKTFSYQPIDFTNLRVGDSTEEAWMSDKDPEVLAEWQVDKKSISDVFFQSVREQVADEGITIDDQAAQYTLEAKIDWLEPGWYAFVVNRPSLVRLRFRVLDRNGTVIDEILVASSTAPRLLDGTVKMAVRLRRDAGKMAGNAARFLRERIQGLPKK